MHDGTKVLLGSHGSSDLDASTEDGDPSTFKAGLAVRRATNGSLSLATGSLIGISLGKSLSDILKTAVARAGNLVPLRLAEYLVKAQLTFIAKVPGSALTIVFTSGATAGSEVVSVAGNAITVQIANATSTTTQIKTAIDASGPASALIEVVIASGQGSTAVSTFTVANIDTLSQPVLGGAVRVSSTTGAAVPSGGTLTGAFYASGSLGAIDPETNAVICHAALIDMAGGL